MFDAGKHTQKLSALHKLSASIMSDDFSDVERAAVTSAIDEEERSVSETFDAQYKDSLAKLEVEQERLVARRKVLSTCTALGDNTALRDLFAKSQATLELSLADLISECAELSGNSRVRATFSE